MTLRATRPGEYPTGLHWTEGETREVPDELAAEAPAWLEAADAASGTVPEVRAP